MSVTFQVPMAEITGYDVACACGPAGMHFATYGEVESFLILQRMSPSRLATCTDEWCEGDTPMLVSHHGNEDAPEVNVCNANAVNILQGLGLPLGDLTGEIDAEDLWARIALNLALAEPSPAVATVSTGNVVSMGRDEGYVQDRLRALLPLVEYAKTGGHPIIWG